MEKEIYNGFEIKFDKRDEVWYTDVGEDGKQAQYSSPDTRVQNASLKKVKELLDGLKRGRFERKNVFVTNDSYRYNSQKEKFVPKYTQAVITSVSPNGNAFIVKKGEKHASKYRLHYSDSELIIDNPENRSTILKIEDQRKAIFNAKKEEEKLKKQLKCFNGKQLYKEVYNKDL